MDIFSKSLLIFFLLLSAFPYFTHPDTSPRYSFNWCSKQTAAFNGAPFYAQSPYHFLGHVEHRLMEKAKQAYFTPPFAVSTGIRLNRKQPYFLCLSGGQRYADRP